MSPRHSGLVPCGQIPLPDMAADSDSRLCEVHADPADAPEQSREATFKTAATSVVACKETNMWRTWMRVRCHAVNTLGAFLRGMSC